MSFSSNLSPQASPNVSFVQKVAPDKPTIAVLGGGIAGLINAYELTKKGYHVHLYEAADRLGGRVGTLENPFGEGGHFDLGGEIIDRKHTYLIDLCKELGIPLNDRHEAIPGDGLMIAGDKRLRDKDMLDPATGEGAYAALADAIRADQAKLRKDGKWTEEAKRLDHLSVDDYLEQKMRETNTDPAVVSILKTSYTSEIGSDSGRLSALNLIDFIGTDRKRDFAIFGDSDETYAVQGGTRRIVDELVKKLDGKVTFHLGERLTLVDPPSTRADAAGVPPVKNLVFTDANGNRHTDSYDCVDMALPLPRLAKVEGLENLGLSAGEIETIRNLQYNSLTKMMVQTKGRPWQEIPGCNGEITTAGSAFQVAWPSNDESSPGTKTKNGTVNFLIGGDQAMLPPEELEAAAKRDYAAALGKPVDQVFTEQKAYVMQHGKSGGCYPAPQPGAYIALTELTHKLSDIPGVGFAGSYMTTPSENGTWIGFMHNAATSGARSAERTIEQLSMIEQAKRAQRQAAAPMLSL